MNCAKTWQALAHHAEQIAGQRMDDWFAQDPNRGALYQLEAAGLHLDYSRNLVTDQGLSLLLELAQCQNLPARIEQMFNGGAINTTEQRAVLHSALRDGGHRVGGKIAQEIAAARQKMDKFVTSIQTSQWRAWNDQPIDTVINIGIGGSDLGPAMVHQALTPYHLKKPAIRYLSNLDGSAFADAVRALEPSTTLFIVASKSFSTQETHKNALAARAWSIDGGVPENQLHRHFVAATSNSRAAVEFGIREENIFPLWDFVGGRYSLWSSIGLPIALGMGMSVYRELLAGARAMDEHFLNSPLAENMPVILGLLGIWNINLLGCQSQAVIPYDHCLARFPAYLQQLDMESNGKSVNHAGTAVERQTSAVLFGEPGTNAQHSFFQLLHQGTQRIPVDFILPAQSHHQIADHHALLIANCLGQARALMSGKSLENVQQQMREKGAGEDEIDRIAPHRVMPGNKPSNLIMMEKLTPTTLGALTALYEHKVFVQSLIWDINAFDQWGVELGKEYAKTMAKSILEGADQFQDSATSAAMQYLKSHGGPHG